MATALASQFRKGDVVYLLGYSSYSGVCGVSATRVTITSMGKKQGTAVRLVDGRNVLHRIYADRQVVCLTADDARAYAAEVGPKDAAESVRRSIICEEQALKYVLPQYKQKVLDRLEQYKARLANPTYELKIIE